MGSSSPDSTAQSTSKFSPRRRDMAIGLATIAMSFAACMALSLWGLGQSTARLAPAPAPAEKIAIKDYPQVGPFELLARSRQLSVRSKFRGLVAKGVTPDGKVDLSKKKSSLRYSFQSPAGIGYQPLRQPGTLPGRRSCGSQSVVADQKGLYAEKDRANGVCPKERPQQLKIEEGCTFQDVWKVARKKKFARKKKVATIEYFEAEGGPAFRFMGRRKKSFVLSARDCKTIFKGKKARGRVP